MGVENQSLLDFKMYYSHVLKAPILQAHVCIRTQVLHSFLEVRAAALLLGSTNYWAKTLSIKQYLAFYH